MHAVTLAEFQPIIWKKLDNYCAFIIFSDVTDNIYTYLFLAKNYYIIINKSWY